MSNSAQSGSKGSSRSTGSCRFYCFLKVIQQSLRQKRRRPDAPRNLLKRPSGTIIVPGIVRAMCRPCARRVFGWATGSGKSSARQPSRQDCVWGGDHQPAFSMCEEVKREEQCPGAWESSLAFALKLSRLGRRASQHSP